MASFATIATGMETALDTVSGLHVYDMFEGSFAVPAAIVDLPEDIVLDFTMSRGADTWNCKVIVLVSKASERAGRKKLYSYISKDSGTPAGALESDRTLGGVVDTLRVTNITNLGQYVVGDIAYLGLQLDVEIIA